MPYTTINKSTDYFNTKLYSGTGSSQAITGVGFQSDWTWIKQRTSTQEHWLVDAVRGTTKFLESNSANAESSDGATGFTSFDSNGFTVNTSARTNQSSNTYASWNWKAGTNGSGTTTGSGTAKAYSYSVSTTAGFSIVKWTGNGTAGHQIPHHLGVKPELILPHKLNYTSDWVVGCEYLDASIPWQKYLKLNTTDAVADGDNYNDVVPTSSVFTVGDTGALNGNDETYVAYCFASKTGYSKIGSYEGNGSGNGTFVYTGFRPKFLMFKKYDASGNPWEMHDDARDTYNPSKYRIMANTTGAEVTENYVDFLSNGFKFRTTDATGNSANSFIYMAFGQSLVGSNNVPCTAR